MGRGSPSSTPGGTCAVDTQASLRSSAETREILGLAEDCQTELDTFATKDLIENYRERLGPEVLVGIFTRIEKASIESYDAFLKGLGPAGAELKSTYKTAAEFMSSGKVTQTLKEKFIKFVNEDVRIESRMDELRKWFVATGQDVTSSVAKFSADVQASWGRMDVSNSLDASIPGAAYMGMPTLTIMLMAGAGWKKSLVVGGIASVIGANPSVARATSETIVSGLGLAGQGAEGVRAGLFDGAHAIASGKALNYLSGEESVTEDDLLMETLGAQGDQIKFYPDDIKNLYEKLNNQDVLSANELQSAADFIMQNTGSALMSAGEAKTLHDRFHGEDDDKLLAGGNFQAKVYDQTLILKHLSNKAAAGLYVKILQSPHYSASTGALSMKEKMLVAKKKLSSVDEDGDPALEVFDMATFRMKFADKVNFNKLKDASVKGRLGEIMPDMELDGVGFLAKYFMIVWAVLQGGFAAKWAIGKSVDGVKNVGKSIKDKFTSKSAKESLEKKGSAKGVFKLMKKRNVISKSEYKRIKKKRKDLGMSSDWNFLNGDEGLKSKLLAANLFSGTRSEAREALLGVALSDENGQEKTLGAVAGITKDAPAYVEAEKARKDGALDLLRGFHQSVISKAGNTDEQYKKLEDGFFKSFIKGFGKAASLTFYRPEDRSLENIWRVLEAANVRYEFIDRIKLSKQSADETKSEYRDRLRKETWLLLKSTIGE